MSDKHALSNVQVSNNINLSLNQNDLIDLAISEQVEILEARIEATEKELEEAKVATNKIKEEFLMSFLKSTNNQVYKDFVGIAEAFGIDTSKSIQGRWHQDNNQNTIIGTFMRVPEINSNASDKILSFKRNSREENFYKYNIDSLELNGAFSTKNRVHVQINEEIELPKAEKAKLNKSLEVFNKKWYQLLLDLYDLNLELVNYKYGEKRIKAKFVKAALGKSKEGQEILAMLGKATNVKLLA